MTACFFALPLLLLLWKLSDLVGGVMTPPYNLIACKNTPPGTAGRGFVYLLRCFLTGT